MEQSIAIAKRLTALCKEKGWDAVVLAEKTSLPVEKAKRMMNVGASNPGVYLMLRICNALEITVDEFFQSEEFKNIDEYRVI